MTELRISEAAQYLGFSDDTIRRWVSEGKLVQHKDSSNRAVVDGRELAAMAQSGPTALDDPTGVASSARNRFTGLVTDVVVDGVMAQVSLQCGPFRVVSLMSAEACRQLELQPGSLATAAVKATMVWIDTPASD